MCSALRGIIRALSACTLRPSSRRSSCDGSSVPSVENKVLSGALLRQGPSIVVMGTSYLTSFSSLTPRKDTPQIHDLLVDCPIGSEDVLEDVTTTMGNARVVRDPNDPDEFFYTPASEDDDGGWAVVRVRDTEDPQATAREIQRRVMGLRIIGVFQRN